MVTKTFQWKQHPEAENFLLELTDSFTSRNPDIATLEQKLLSMTSSRLFDWIDHLVVETSTDIKERLENLGFLPQEDPEGVAYSHPGLVLPQVLLIEGKQKTVPGAAVKVDSIADFLQCNSYQAEIEGEFREPLRKCLVSVENTVGLYAVERRGARGFTPHSRPAGFGERYLKALEHWQTRPRDASRSEEVFSFLIREAGELVRSMGTDTAAHVICEAERRYWLARNLVAGVQKMRQDRLGMGWANHDHHTFRSSRRHFTSLVEFFTLLGFQKRERFYAGREAGWGAQVMENPTAGLSLFLDVDLAPEEVEVDFSTIELPEREELGTVGLWCALHGDSILDAGMHHLAAHYLFDQLPHDLERHEIAFMAPFSEFDYLKQSFSKGEIWQVNPDRVSTLLDEKRINQEKADKFISKGAIGSHLENIQRREGYKGFNKKNVNIIIRGTDPRTYE